jgi:DNA-binding transcriptional LysR family regulator
LQRLRYVAINRGDEQSLQQQVAVRARSARFGSHLKTRQLAILVHLDDERSTARAAAAAGLTQPAASKLLHQVESELGVKLFERNSRGMAPTCYGEILVRHARLALSEIGLARDEITAVRSGLSGRAAIGAVLSPGVNLVPLAVAQMKLRCPGIVVHVEIDSSRKLVEKLLQGELDMVVGRLLDTARSNELSYELLKTDEPHAVISSSQHPLAGRKDLQLEDLIAQPWIFPPEGSLLREKLAAMFMQHGLPLPSIVETLSIPVITSLLQHSNMLAALPEEAVQSACKAGILTVLLRKLPVNMGAFGIIVRRQNECSPAAQLMLKRLRELAAHYKLT